MIEQYAAGLIIGVTMISTFVGFIGWLVSYTENLRRKRFIRSKNLIGEYDTWLGKYLTEKRKYEE